MPWVQKGNTALLSARRAISGGLISVDLHIYLIPVAPNIGPCIRKVFCAKGRITSEQVGLSRSKAAGLLKHPDRNPCAYDTGLSAANIGITLDAWDCIAKIAHDPLQHLRLFGAGHTGK